MKRLMLIHKDRNKLQKDGFTYGDWRQYVAFFEDNTAVCCRISGLPSGLFIAGFVMLSIAGMGGWMAYMGVSVYWSRIIPFAILGILMMVPVLITEFTRWRLVVPVSGRIKADENGSYWRDI